MNTEVSDNDDDVVFYDAKSIGKIPNESNNESQQILNRKIGNVDSYRNIVNKNNDFKSHSVISSITSDNESGTKIKSSDSVADSTVSSDKEEESVDSSHGYDKLSYDRKYLDDLNYNAKDSINNKNTINTTGPIKKRSIFSSFNKYFSNTTRINSNGEVSVKLKNKTNSEFTGLKLSQSLHVHDGAIWSMCLSYDGEFLATGGQDGRIIIWKVGGPSDASVSNNNHQNSVKIPTDNFQLFHSSPYRIFHGHTGDITYISWSKSNFLLSASVDTTVRLWHVSRDDCLQVFKHVDIVTGVAFHPTHDRYFVSSCFDRRIRIWDIIPDGVVKDWCLAPGIITAVNFSLDGNVVAAGLLNGQVFFYDAEGLKYITQIFCQNSRGSYKAGRKVTGLIFRKITSSNNASTQSSAANIGSQLLVTTNDNRLRLIDMSDYSQITKYKGANNSNMQIRACFSEDEKYIISGSEDGKVCIWNTSNNNINNNNGLLSRVFTWQNKKIIKNNSYEYFYSNIIKQINNSSIKSQKSNNTDISIDENESCTVAFFAPSASVSLACSMNNITTISPNGANNLCTNVILTASSNGIIRIFTKKF